MHFYLLMVHFYYFIWGNAHIILFSVGIDAGWCFSLLFLGDISLLSLEKSRNPSFKRLKQHLIPDFFWNT